MKQVLTPDLYDKHNVPWVDVMVEIERPGKEELHALGRGERYRLLKDNAAEHRNQLEAWIEAQGLEDQVVGISEATTFSLLFVRCSPVAAEALAHAPGVVEVMQTEKLPLELLRHRYICRA